MISQIRVIIIFIFFSKPTISILEQVDALIYLTEPPQSWWRCAWSPSNCFLLHISMLSSQSSAQQTEKDAIFWQFNMHNLCCTIVHAQCATCVFVLTGCQAIWTTFTTFLPNSSSLLLYFSNYCMLPIIHFDLSCCQLLGMSLRVALEP